MAITLTSGVIVVTDGVLTGTASSGTSTTLVHSGQAWTTNIYAGRTVRIRTGTGAGQIRHILSNTSNTLTITPAWTTNPASGSTYVISHNFDDVLAANNAGSWGRVTRQGTNQFTLTAPMDIGTSTNAACFSDINKHIVMTGTVAGSFHNVNAHFYIRVYSDSVLRFGYVDDLVKKTTRFGCTLQGLVDINEGSMIVGTTIAKIEIYSSHIYMLRYSYVQLFSPSSGAIFNIYNSIIGCDILTFGPFSFADIFNVTMLLNWVPFSIGIRTKGSVVNATVYGAEFGAIGSSLDWGIVTRGVFARNNNWFFFACGMTAPSYVIDADTDAWSINWYAFCNPCTAPIFRQWSHNFTVANSLTNVRFAMFDKDNVSVLNNVTGAGGVLPEVIITEGTYTQPTNQTLQSLNPHRLVIRRYGNVYLSMSRTVSGKVVEGITLSTNPYVVANEATAGAYTGIAINGTNKTITISQARSVQEIYDYSQWWAAQSGNMQFDEPITTADGTNFLCANGWTLTGFANITVDARVLKLRSSGGAITTSYASIGVTNTVSGSTCRISRTDNDTVLASGTSGTSFNSARLAWTANIGVTIRVRRAGHLPFEAQGTFTENGLTLTANQIADPVYQV